MEHDRRRFLRLGGLVAAGALAGCGQSGQGGQRGTTGTQTNSPTGTETATATETGTQTGTRTETTEQSSTPPGADQLGGPNDLQSSPTVEAMVLQTDQGAGKYVFSPAVVWVETGATVTWKIEDASHSVTAYSSATDKPSRIPNGAEPFDSKIRTAGETYEHTFETGGVYDYFCIPHESLGMVGLVVVGSPAGGPGATDPKEIEASTAKQHLSRLLEIVGGSGESTDSTKQAVYGWMDATWDSYWYSLYNMSANISMSANGVVFPHDEDQRMAFEQRFPAMLKAADRTKPPVENANLNMAAFTEADPHFTQKPVLEGPDGRPDASTLTWADYSGVVSPSSLAWTHLKGVTWAKNFQNHADVLPESLAPLFRAEVLTTLAQLGIMASLVAGGPEGNGALTKGESLELVSEFNPETGEVVDDTTRPNHHSAMVWFLSDMTSLASGGWFGYENPEPLIPAVKIQELADGMAKTTMNVFSPAAVVEAGSTRDLGQMLGAIGWYGTHAGSSELQSMAGEYANALASEVEADLASSGMIENGTDNQAATQGAVGQGLIWASQIDGVDHTEMATNVIGYLVNRLYDEESGIFVGDPSASTHTITARDAGDITGGINAADAVMGTSGVKERYTSFFDQTFNCGRLQRAQRPPSVDGSAECPLPLPPKSGGRFGQAAVYNAAVEYDSSGDEWSVTDDTFDTAQALYLANQDIWISHWGGEFYQGRGVPGKSDSP